MKNRNPILVLTGLAVAAAAGVAGITRDSWMGDAPKATTEAPAQPVAETATTAAEPAAPEAQQPPPQAASTETAAPAAEEPAAAPAQPGGETAAAASQEQQVAAVAPAEETAGADAASADEVVPTFDTVRVEKTGEAVIAGRAEAGADVTVKFEGQNIARTTANDDGAFVVVPEKPLPAGSGVLTIEAQGKDDAAPVVSEQSVAVIVPAGQQQAPLVAVVSPDQPTRVLQKPSAAPAAAPDQPVAEAEPAQPEAAETAEAPAAEPEAAPQPKPAKLVSIDAVDYDPSGNIVFSGEGEAGNTARLYVDNTFLGDAPVGADGRWTFSGTADVSKGVHTLRVDGLDASGNVLNRVEVPFFREDQAKVADASQPAQQETAGEPAAASETVAEPTPAAEEQAAAVQSEAPAEPAQEAEQAGETVAQQPAQEPAATEPAATEPAATEPAATEQAETAAATPETQPVAEETAPEATALAKPKEGRVVIQPGNNLWRMSRVLYGSGAKFTVLYEANKDQIRNPNRIYPGQVFRTPDVVPNLDTVDPRRRTPLSPEESAGTE